MRRLKRRSTGFDPAMGDRELQEAIVHLRDGDWRFVEDLITRRDDTWLLRTVLHDPEADIPFGCFVTWKTQSGSANAVAHLGHALTAEAWRIRGTVYADEVTETIRNAFLAALEEAEVTLHDAAAMDPSSAEPWVGLMSTARGLELPRDEIERRFVEVHARDAFRPDACHQMLQTLCAKWIGSHEEMFDFADWIRRSSPADSPCVDLSAMAHIEYALSGHEPGLDLTAYFSRPRVADDLQSAAQRLLDATSTRAETHHLQALNLFLLTVEPIDSTSAHIARETIRRIDDRPTAVPWRADGSRADVRFAQVRDARARAARRF